jgi:hypothetical protein
LVGLWKNNWKMVAYITEINWYDHWQVAKTTDMQDDVLCKYSYSSKPDKWLFHNDNVSANWSPLVQNCLTTNVTSVLPQPPCFLCLSPAINHLQQLRDTTYEQQKRSNTSTGGACRARHAKQLSAVVQGLRETCEFGGVLIWRHCTLQHKVITGLFTRVKVPNILVLPHITPTACM